MKRISVKKAGSKAVKGLAMCWVFRKRSFSISGSFRQLYHDEIRLKINSNKKVFGYRRFGDNQVLLAYTKWKAVGFMESEVVRWLNFQRINNSKMAEFIEEEGFRFKEFPYTRKRTKKLEGNCIKLQTLEFLF